ncbi:MAG TPA: FecR domain-containing protein [Parasegetibacter sp.]
MTSSERIQYLFQQFLKREATPAELEELFLLLKEENADSSLNPELQKLWSELESYPPDIPSEKMFQQIQLEIGKHIPAQVISVSWWRRWKGRVVAAAVIFLIATGAYFVADKYAKNSSLNNGLNPLAVANEQTDVQPGKEGAILTLADGTQMVLDTLPQGVLAEEAGMLLKLTDAGLTYDLLANAGGVKPVSDQEEPAYNTLSTPKGRQFALQLPDGSRVWLNAASSIRFPVHFNGKERKVEITGEAYFEVVSQNASNLKSVESGSNNLQKIPFVVKTKFQTIQVLGTRFNVNAYDDENTLRTTLLEGKVRVDANPLNQPNMPKVTGAPYVILLPGQQAVTHKNSTLTDSRSSLTTEQVSDMDQVMAWKNGLFSFEGATLEEVMRQLSRWYDIEVVYEKDIPDMKFGGKMSRNIKLSDLIAGLQDLRVKFRLEDGKRLIVMP